MDQAKRLLHSSTRPNLTLTSPLTELPVEALHPEFDLDETSEASLTPFITNEMMPSDVWMEYRVERPVSIILAVDLSASMSGEKLAWMAVALACVLLEYSCNQVGVIGFENTGQVFHHPRQNQTIENILLRLMNHPAQGYTHLEEGLKGALRMTSQLNRPEKSKVILLSDGKYTAGKNPTYLAPKFSHLTVIKLGEGKEGLLLCRNLARLGRGEFKQIRDHRELPKLMKILTQSLSRGRRA